MTDRAPRAAPVAVPVVLDVDTGVDDACALLLAARHPGLDLEPSPAWPATPTSTRSCAAAAASVPVTMYGLTSSTLPGSPAAGLPNWPGASSVAARPAGRLVAFQCARFDEPDATIGDAGAVCAVIDPGGLTTRSSPVRIELAGTWTRGQTIVDQRDWGGDLAHDPHGLAPAVVDVALAVEADRYAGLWLEAVSG